MKQRLILIGGSGFIGQSLLRYLEEKKKRSQYQILIYDIQKPKFFEPDQYVEGRLEQEEKLGNLLYEQDLLVHLVHTTLPAEGSKAREREFSENFQPSIRLIELLRPIRVRGIIYFSSGGTIYGEPIQQKPIPESAKANPNSFYGLTKLMIEEALMMAGRLGWLNYLIVRPGNPFGPFQEQLNRHGVVGKIFQAIQRGEKFVIWGRGETIRDYIYIDDLISALLLLMDKGERNQVYNIGTGHGTSLKDLIKLCEKISGKRLKKVFKPRRETDLRYNVLNCKKLLKLGWKPEIELSQGLQKTWEYFLKSKAV